MHNYANILRLNNQQKIVQNPEINRDIIQSPIKFFAGFTDAERRVLNAMLYMHGSTGKVYMRQDTLGKYADCTREHVNRIIKKFRELGIVSSIYRHKTSCWYFISDFFKDHFNRSKLKHIFHALSFFAIAHIEPDITQYISNLFINSSKQLSSSLPEGNFALETRARTREEKIEMSSKAMIPAHIASIEDPHLNLEEKRTLSQYREGAIRHALIQYQKNKDRIYKPVAFLVSCCKQYEEKRAGVVRHVKVDNARPAPTRRTEDRSQTERLIQQQDMVREQQQKQEIQALSRKGELQDDRIKLAHMDTQEAARYEESAKQRAGAMSGIMIDLFRAMLQGARDYHATIQCVNCPLVASESSSQQSATIHKSDERSQDKAQVKAQLVEEISELVKQGVQVPQEMIDRYKQLRNS